MLLEAARGAISIRVYKAEEMSKPWYDMLQIFIKLRLVRSRTAFFLHNVCKQNFAPVHTVFHQK